jgi:hypothetical protein
MIISILQGVMQGVKCILFNPQFVTTTGGTAPWDFGGLSIKGFSDMHICNKYCRYLNLPHLNPDSHSFELPYPTAQLGQHTDAGAGADAQDEA